MLDGDGLEILGCADWVGCLEDGLELFEGATDSLDTKEVPDGRLDDVPSDEDLGENVREAVGIDEVRTKT